jgi:glycosyltransferase involved in cell wall biosynthesis
VWPISRFNGRSLAAMGFPVDLDKTLPMPVVPLTRRLDPRGKSGPITIAFVSRIVPAKGVHVLVDAFELLTARGYDDVELVIVGSTYISGYAGEIRRRIEKGPLKNARFLGKLSQAKLARVYEQACIVAIPSFHEGLCVPVIEALYAGAIPVVSDTSALPETLNGFGRLSPAGDAAALADRLAEVVADIRAIRRDPRHAKLRVERGAMSVDDYQKAVSCYLDTFAPATLGRELVRRLSSIA